MNSGNRRIFRTVRGTGELMRLIFEKLPPFSSEKRENRGDESRAFWSGSLSLLGRVWLSSLANPSSLALCIYRDSTHDESKYWRNNYIKKWEMSQFFKKKCEITSDVIITWNYDVVLFIFFSLFLLCYFFFLFYLLSRLLHCLFFSSHLLQNSLSFFSLLLLQLLIWHKGSKLQQD